MKKMITMLSVVSLMAFVLMPLRVDAALYGEWSASCTGWKEQSDGSKLETCTYSLTPSAATTYVYVEIVPSNVKITSYLESSNFKVVKSEPQDNGRVRYLLQATSSTGAPAGTKVDVLTVLGNLIDVNSDVCNLSYTPLSMNCVIIDNKYFNDRGEEVTQEEYNTACSGVVPDDPNDIPNSETGSVVPYIAIGGGLLAIAGVSLYSRKANKVYKI